MEESKDDRRKRLCNDRQKSYYKKNSFLIREKCRNKKNDSIIEDIIDDSKDIIDDSKDIIDDPLEPINEENDVLIFVFSGGVLMLLSMLL
jgi:hypothetical protein